MLADEIERLSSLRPSFVKLYGHNNPAAPYRTWMALFVKPPRPGFRVFDESGLVMLHKIKKSLKFCKRCNVHHSSKNCSRAPSFGNCGSTMHTEAPHDPSAVLALLNWTPPPCSVIAGDFNSVYWAWQSGATHTYGKGDEVESWAESYNLSCLIIDKPTHRAGNTLNLAWTNIGRARA
ncbi:hypothetical protein EPUL_004098 [Erysiphe pulchra]|uniref:Endonuclease/exonuclease/phosphatase domain-containing protein n=1 Tax=Erysiphe pulchra TaxID=225359 RepID=A0A2S4PTA1_9PEZI|nr:hypothetical protein EPUL_004098 [Erysiphe pulchra]